MVAFYSVWADSGKCLKPPTRHFPGTMTSRSAKLQFLRQCVEEHSAGNLLRKSSPQLTPETVSRKMTSSFAGINQQRMMSFIYGSLAGQTIGSEKMKHSLSEQALGKLHFWGSAHFNNTGLECDSGRISIKIRFDCWMGCWSRWLGCGLEALLVV